MSLLGPDLGTVVTRVCPVSFERAVPVLSIINDVKTKQRLLGTQPVPVD